MQTCTFVFKRRSGLVRARINERARLPLETGRDRNKTYDELAAEFMKRGSSFCRRPCLLRKTMLCLHGGESTALTGTVRAHRDPNGQLHIQHTFRAQF